MTARKYENRIQSWGIEPEVQAPVVEKKPGTRGDVFKVQVGGEHYKTRFPFCQPAEFLERNHIPASEGHVMRYVLRHDLKNGIEDLRKAKHYLEIIAFCRYGEEL